MDTKLCSGRKDVCVKGKRYRVLGLKVNQEEKVAGPTKAGRL